MIDIAGDVAEGFGPVVDAFEANFAEGGELGAAFCAHLDGRPVVDIWAGVADHETERPWDRETLQLVFSTTKGATAICIARLVEAGVLDYDEPVVTYWPEFGANGKEAISVGHIMSHQAGLAAVDAELSLDEILAVEPVVEALEGQAPLWEPGSAHGYHALTYGWLAGEIVRRVDGRSLGTYFAEEVAGPLGLDFWIGLPAEEEDRVGRLRPAPPPSDPEMMALMAQMIGPGTLGFRALTMSGAFPIGNPDDTPFNRRDVHATEMPAANGITTARSLSRLYAATIGTVDGVRLLSDEAIEVMRKERVNGPDQTLVVPTRFGYGMMLHSELSELFDEGSYGHAGAGGSLGYAHPEAGLAYGYVMNQMGGDLAGDPRTRRLNAALRTCIG